MNKHFSFYRISVLFGIAIIGFFALVILSRYSFTDLVTTSSYIANVSPTVVSVYISSQANGLTDDYPLGTIYDLVAGSTRTIHVNGVVQDLNGRSDVTSVSASFRRSDIPLTSCDSTAEQDSNYCYYVDTCTLTNNANTDQKAYDCAMALEYFIDATDAAGLYPNENWIVDVQVSDGDSSNTNSSVTKEVASVLALSIPGSISYGILSLGEFTTSASNYEMVISQAGNTAADVEVFSTQNTMTCSIRGTIDISLEQWSLSDVSYGHVDANSLTSSAVDTNLNVERRSDDSQNTSKKLYWNIKVPDSGIEGTCTGTNTITAVVAS